MFAPFPRESINLRTDRIARDDAERQMRTAEALLVRLGRYPGVVLADEVGMGKTFVALAVAASVILDRAGADPIVVMVPPSLKEKWPRDWDVFRRKCLSEKVRDQIRYDVASSGVEFLRLLDDEDAKRAHIIFLTHGALHRALTDGFVKLAVIKRAFKGRPSLGEQRRNFHKFAGSLLRMDSYVESYAEGLLGHLLDLPYEKWLGAIHRAHNRFKEEVTDDPVPRHLQAVLEEDVQGEDLAPLIETLGSLPLRTSANVEERLKDVRQALSGVMNEIWKTSLRKARFTSPLLILDEAHHLKNPETQLASLFVDEEAAKEGEYFDTGGALGGKFERMLFLTATPFQLGHHELVRVLERFEGIAWNSSRAPELTRPDFKKGIGDLENALNDAQAAALRLDAAWGRASQALHATDGGVAPDAEGWWQTLEAAGADGIGGALVERVSAAKNAICGAELLLRPWVVRHLKPTHLEGVGAGERRRVLPGAGINSEETTERGLDIGPGVLLPFLLAGRVQALLAASKGGRALFAEGLASSFEAYTETRAEKGTKEEDAVDAPVADESEEVKWYLGHLDHALRRDGEGAKREHPKVQATAARVVDLWKKGEKALVFCHYRATGRALIRHISSMMQEEILAQARLRLPNLPKDDLSEELQRIGKRFFDTDGSLRKSIDQALDRILSPFASLTVDEKEAITDVVRRFLRTPSFLVRYFDDLGAADDPAAFAKAIERDDLGRQSLRYRIDTFVRFLAERCVPNERSEYLAALKNVQTGTHVGREVSKVFDSAECFEEAARVHLLPNVRLANGEVQAATRRRLLLTFNTPLFPEVLVASSVLAEGVDLHLNCRFVIHHDLCWNPSTLEQRTGRVDRIGSKAEVVGAPIYVYLPYVEATQDEKMYRVVKDRERWFQVVMGEKYEVDEASTDRQAERVPLPDSVLKSLTMHLGI